MNVLVIGASGYVGSHLVPALVQRGHHVRAAARSAALLETRGWQGVECSNADVLNPETLRPVLRGIDVAYYLVHSMGSRGDFQERDRIGARNFAEAARLEGVGRIVYLGGLQPQGEASAHLESRRETGELLRASGIPVTELRAGIIVGPGSAAFEVIRDLVNHLPVMTTPRWVTSRSQPIALGDLIEYLCQVAESPATAGRTFDVGGPEFLSYAELLRQFAQVTGKRCHIIPLPVLTPRLSSYWLDLVTSVPASVVRPLIDGLRHDLPADDAEIRRLLPIALHTYREAVETALREERLAPLPSRWTEGALAFRGYNPDVSFYSKGARVQTPVHAPAERVWELIASIGGNRGYYYADVLWRLRGLLDRCVGGVGMRRGRRHPQDIRAGDAVDFWRVVEVDPGKRLTLVAEMKVPGAAALEFEVIPSGDDACTLVTSARFHPAGLPGLLYWYLLLPIHNQIFDGMPAAMRRAAEAGLRA
ncbi:MAG: SDR family oxidoreductase [Dehalococcoidia bacterium]|nr:MAG: SDR family oxidoreductase [Dehalococcoidia bacterium]